MLIKFHSSTSGELLMFAETARALLGVLEKECTARGVVTLEELPGSIARLRAAMASAGAVAKTSPAEESADELPVGFRQRATPFVELMERTLADEGFVLWEAPADFDA